MGEDYTYLGLTQVPIFKEKGDFRVTSPYGYRIHPVTHKPSGHSGIDGVRNEHDLATIVAIEDGEVIDVCNFVEGYSDTYTKGNYVRIKHASGRHSLYLHLAYKTIPSDVRVGYKINRGMTIGTMGSTGRSTDAHIHFQVYDTDGATIIDPTPFLLGKNINNITEEDDMWVEVEPCKYGDKGDIVKKLQMKVSQLSAHYLKEVQKHSMDKYGDFDGVFGKGMISTLKEIQEEAGLLPTGECDQDTVELLNNNVAVLKGIINRAVEVLDISSIIE